MTDFNAWSVTALWVLLEVTIGASLCFLVILAVQRVLGKQLRANWRYALWGVLLIRMLVPFNYEAILFTAFTIPRTEPIPPVAAPAFTMQTADTGAAITDTPPPVEPAPQLQSVEVTAPVPTPASTTPDFSEPRELPIAAVLFTLWAAGALAVIARVAVHHLRLSRMIEREALAAPDSVSHVLRRVRDELGITMWPVALVSPAIATPTVVGALRPRVLLPKTLAETASTDEMRLILMHELVHIQRRDLFIAWLWLFALSIHWFNPLMWVAGALMRRDREKACDQRVLAALPDHERLAYGHILLKAVAPMGTNTTFNRYAGTAAIAENESEIEERLTMVRDYRPSRTPHRILGALSALSLAGIAFTQFWAVAQEETKAPATSAPKAAVTDPKETPNPFADISDAEQLETLANQAIAQGDFFRACDAHLRRVDVALERNRPTNRIELTSVFSDLKSENPSLTDAAKRDLLVKLESYAAAHPAPEHQWRILELQSSIAKNIGEYDRAVAYLDRALPLVPGLSDNSPRTRNPFHEMVADRIEFMLRKDGQEAAEGYLLNLWKTDARFNPRMPDFLWRLSVYNSTGTDRQQAVWRLMERLGEKPAIQFAQAATSAAGTPHGNALAAITDEVELGRLRDEAAKSGDLIRACEAEMRRVKLRGEQGNAYKDKIDLTAAYALMPPTQDRDELQKRIGQLTNFASAHADDIDYAWRIWHLRSVIWAEIGHPDQQKTALQQAIMFYPRIKYSDPSKHSKFQHLVNELAMLLWNHPGIDSAEKLVVEMWKHDRRFAYFYELPWATRYTKEFNNTDRLDALRERMGDKPPLERFMIILSPEGPMFGLGNDSQQVFPATWDQIEEELNSISDPFDYFIALGYTSEDISLATWSNAQARAFDFVQKLGFDHLSDIGKQEAPARPDNKAAAAPTKATTTPAVAAGPLVVEIALDGTCTVNGEIVGDAALVDVLREHAAPEALLELHVHSSTNIGLIQNVMKAAQSAGRINVSITEILPDTAEENTAQ